MNLLPTILIILLILSLILNHLSISKEKSSMRIVNEMGIGYNLGNSFDSYDIYKEIKNPDEQITLFGNPIPTKKLIINIKKNGFNTIRFPVTWINFIDDFGNINPKWILRVKQVVKWIIEKNIYCILNLYHDGDAGNWLNNRNNKNIYVNFWKQIAEEFKDYNEYLIFESMNKPLYLNLYNYNYDFLFDLTQSFVDIIRNSEGYNKKRLLLISGMNADLALICNSNYKIPIDPANKFAISIHYYYPYAFTSSNNKIFENSDKWGNQIQYKEI